MIEVSIVNQSTAFPDAQLLGLANVLQLQVSGDFFPAWGVNAKIYYTPTGKHPTASHWVLALLDDADQAGALGYHDVTPTGLPLGKVFVKTTQSAGDSVSVTASHELLEMLGDPDINLTAERDDASGAPSKFYAYEVCDAVELDFDGYEVTAFGTTLVVSNFVLPSWFEAFRTTGPFDFRGLLTQPFQLRTGGYIGMLDLANLAAGWQQVMAMEGTSAKKQALARPHLGSRRQRRQLRRSDWLYSTYEPGDAATDPSSGKTPGV